jgi:cell division transport system permease protein
MKFIGATDWFIRWPFILEGAFIGILGGVIALALLYFGYKFTYYKVSSQFIIMQLINPSYILSTMLAEFILGGIFIGVVGSVSAIRKFLQV